MSTLQPCRQLLSQRHSARDSLAETVMQIRPMPQVFVVLDGQPGKARG